MENFSTRIRKLRLERDLTQEELGKEIGVKNYSVYSYEKGRAYPDAERLMALADFFGVSMDYLMGRTDKREVNR